MTAYENCPPGGYLPLKKEENPAVVEEGFASYGSCRAVKDPLNGQVRVQKKFEPFMPDSYAHPDRASHFGIEVPDHVDAVLTVIEDPAEAEQAFKRFHEGLAAGKGDGAARSWNLAHAPGWVRLSAAEKAEPLAPPKMKLGLDPAKKEGIVEINVPGKHGDANSLSAAARDEQGRIWIIRQGRLHQNGSSDVHWNQFNAVTSLAAASVRMSKPRGRKWYRVAMLDVPADEVQRQTSAFVRHCALVRAHFGAPSEILDPAIAEHPVGRPEIPYEYVVSATEEKTVQAIHAKVWQDLKQAFYLRGIDSWKPPSRDGYEVDLVVRGSSPMLIEIKTGATAADVYEGVGQLMLYPKIFSDLAGHRRVLMLPGGGPRPALKDAVTACGIELAHYEGTVDDGFRFGPNFLGSPQVDS